MSRDCPGEERAVSVAAEGPCTLKRTDGCDARPTITTAFYPWRFITTPDGTFDLKDPKQREEAVAKAKKKAPKKAKKGPGVVEAEFNRLTVDPIPPPPPGFDPKEAAQEALDKLGTVAPSVQSGGAIVMWLDENAYKAVEYRLSRIVEGE